MTHLSRSIRGKQRLTLGLERLESRVPLAADFGHFEYFDLENYETNIGWEPIGEFENTLALPRDDGFIQSELPSEYYWDDDSLPNELSVSRADEFFSESQDFEYMPLFEEPEFYGGYAEPNNLPIASEHFFADYQPADAFFFENSQFTEPSSEFGWDIGPELAFGADWDLFEQSTNQQFDSTFLAHPSNIALDAEEFAFGDFSDSDDMSGVFESEGSDLEFYIPIDDVGVLLVSNETEVTGPTIINFPSDLSTQPLESDLPAVFQEPSGELFEFPELIFNDSFAGEAPGDEVFIPFPETLPNESDLLAALGLTSQALPSESNVTALAAEPTSISIPVSRPTDAPFAAFSGDSVALANGLPQARQLTTRPYNSLELVSDQTDSPRTNLTSSHSVRNTLTAVHERNAESKLKAQSYQLEMAVNAARADANTSEIEIHPQMSRGLQALAFQVLNESNHSSRQASFPGSYLAGQASLTGLESWTSAVEPLEDSAFASRSIFVGEPIDPLSEMEEFNIFDAVVSRAALDLDNTSVDLDAVHHTSMLSSAETLVGLGLATGTFYALRRQREQSSSSAKIQSNRIFRPRNANAELDATRPIVKKLSE